MARFAAAIASVAALCLSSATAQTQNQTEKALTCTASYTAAYVASLTGACNLPTCTPACQTIIDKVTTDCKGQTYNTSEVATGAIKEASFLNKAHNALRLMGPATCDYGVFGTGGKSKTCATQCSMKEVTGGSNVSFYELNGCIKVDSSTHQSAQGGLLASWQNCDKTCRDKFQTLVTDCDSCYDPVMNAFLADASAQLIKCAVGIAGEGSCDKGLENSLIQSCCAGTDGVAGNRDDTCDFVHTFPDCTDYVAPDPSKPLDRTHRQSICAAAVQSAGRSCPANFVGDGDKHPLGNRRWMGMYEDCGGKISQLYAANPHSTVNALYCNDPRINMHAGIAMPSDFHNDGRRALEAGAEEAVALTTHARRLEDLDAEESADVKLVEVKRLMDHPLTQIRRQLQQSTAVPSTSNLQCSMAYQTAFVSTISGDCALTTCSAKCQNKITSMLQLCKNVTYTENNTEIGVTVQRSFSQKAVLALQILGPQNCDYGLLYGGCSPDCTMANASATLKDCATFFMSVDFHSWDACSDTGRAGKPTKEQCFDKYLGFVHKCQGCVDPFVSTLLSKTAAAVAAPTHSAADKGCEDCSDKVAVALNIGNICCAGPDGILGNGDDNACTQQNGTADPAHPNLPVPKWWIPTTCDQDSACQAYITALAIPCVSDFLQNPLAGVYTDCGGSLGELITHGRDCKMTVSAVKPRYGGTGTCNTSRSGGPDGIAGNGDDILTLRSGASCELSCDTGYCIGFDAYNDPRMAQPSCFDGTLRVDPSIAGSQHITCTQIPLTTCEFPPNGGCDPASICNDNTNLFGTKLIQCGGCPHGYFGSGRKTCDAFGCTGGCHDFDECMNNGCDKRTSCTNFPGGFRCGPCPRGYTGSGETGCLLPGQALEAKNESLVQTIKYKQEELDALTRICSQTAHSMGANSAELHTFENTQDTTCDLCKFGCSAELYPDCAYEIPIPPYCQVDHDHKNLTYFKTPEQLQGAITGCVYYIANNQKITGTGPAPAPAAGPQGLIATLTAEKNQNVLFFYGISMVVAIAATSLFCWLCTAKRVSEGAGAFEKINVGDIGTGPSIYDSTWAR